MNVFHSIYNELYKSQITFPSTFMYITFDILRADVISFLPHMLYECVTIVRLVRPYRPRKPKYSKWARIHVGFMWNIRPLYVGIYKIYMYIYLRCAIYMRISRGSTLKIYEAMSRLFPLAFLPFIFLNFKWLSYFYLENKWKN